MTIQQYINNNGLTTNCTDVEELNAELVSVREQSDGYELYVQPGYFVWATVAEEA